MWLNHHNSDLGGGRRALEPGGDDPGVRAGGSHQDHQQAGEQAQAAVSKVRLSEGEPRNIYTEPPIVIRYLDTFSLV